MSTIMMDVSPLIYMQRIHFLSVSHCMQALIIFLMCIRRWLLHLAQKDGLTTTNPPVLSMPFKWVEMGGGSLRGLCLAFKFCFTQRRKGSKGAKGIFFAPLLPLRLCVKLHFTFYIVWPAICNFVSHELSRQTDQYRQTAQ